MVSFSTVVCLALLMVAVVSATPVTGGCLLPDAAEHFQKFISDFGRKYANADEMNKRFEIFRRTLEKIDAQNAGSTHAVFGITEFADRTWEEIQLGCILQKPADDDDKCQKVRDEDISVEEAPEEWDWRKQNVVTRVKDQGDCGSCWAFSVTGNLESQYARKYNNLIEFSEQQLVDCDKDDNGCGGGWPLNAFGYWMKQSPMSEQDYCYKGREGTCRFDKTKVKVNVRNCTQYLPESEEKLKQLLYTQGPLSVAIDADDVSSYKGGIMDNCEGGGINHGVLLVGYGTENGKPYWIFKNSWGEDKGERGYFRTERGTNQCGLMGPEGLISSAVL